MPGSVPETRAYASSTPSSCVSESGSRWPKSGIVKATTTSGQRLIAVNACRIGFGRIKLQSLCIKSSRMHSDERPPPPHDRPFWPARRNFLDRTPSAHCQGKPSPPKTRSRDRPHPRADGPRFAKQTHQPAYRQKPLGPPAPCRHVTGSRRCTLRQCGRRSAQSNGSRRRWSPGSRPGSGHPGRCPPQTDPAPGRSCC